jgi:hypothetical protein
MNAMKDILRGLQDRVTEQVEMRFALPRAQDLILVWGLLYCPKSEKSNSICNG